MNRPKAWKRYISHVKATDQVPDQMLANFSARYRFASSLVDLGLPGYSEGTKHGYLVVTKLAYAYSALEALERGISAFSVKDRSQIIDFRMAKHLADGKFDDALMQIVEAAEPTMKARVQVGLNSMMSNLDSGNVRPFVEGVRNSLFHGKFTPASSGLRTSKSKREMLGRLAEEILLGADDVFRRWLEAELLKN